MFSGNNYSFIYMFLLQNVYFLSDCSDCDFVEEELFPDFDPPPPPLLLLLLLLEFDLPLPCLVLSTAVAPLDMSSSAAAPL